MELPAGRGGPVGMAAFDPEVGREDCAAAPAQATGLAAEFGVGGVALAVLVARAAQRQHITHVQAAHRAGSEGKAEDGHIFHIDGRAAAGGDVGGDSHNFVAGDEAHQVQIVAAQPGEDAAARIFLAE